MCMAEDETDGATVIIENIMKGHLAFVFDGQHLFLMKHVRCSVKYSL